MDPLVILALGALFGAASALTGWLIAYRRKKRALTDLRAQVLQAEQELEADIRLLGAENLARTEAGREVLRLLETAEAAPAPAAGARQETGHQRRAGGWREAFARFWDALFRTPVWAPAALLVVVGLGAGLLAGPLASQLSPENPQLAQLDRQIVEYNRDIGRLNAQLQTLGPGEDASRLLAEKHRLLSQMEQAVEEKQELEATQAGPAEALAAAGLALLGGSVLLTLLAPVMAYFFNRRSDVERAESES